VSAEVKAMIRGGGGAIVNTSSVGSLIGHNNPALPAYGAAKRAVNSITESAALTYAANGSPLPCLGHVSDAIKHENQSHR
jgi:NAD(P)-dependent dehydrogenase (short-subunit alcohol dehydrogenase family)